MQSFLNCVLAGQMSFPVKRSIRACVGQFSQDFLFLQRRVEEVFTGNQDRSPATGFPVTMTTTRTASGRCEDSEVTI